MLTSLISNLQKITKDGKESYFGKRWSAEAGLKKTVDRADYTFDDVSKASPAKQLNEQILTSFQTTADGERQQFVERLTKESLSFLAKRKGMRLQQMHAEALCSESMSLIVRRVFDRLEQYSIELNAYLGCTDMQTAVTRPAHVREVVRYSKSRQPLETVTYFRARLASPSWSLVIRGNQGKIEFFLLPVSRVMGLTKTEAMFEPICTLTATVINGMSEVEWEIDEHPFTPQHEQNLSMELFARLIEITRGEMEEEALLM